MRVFSSDRLTGSDWSVVRASGLFQSLDAGRWNALLQQAELIMLPSCGPLFADGQPADRLYLVLDGLVGLLATAGRGAVLGCEDRRLVDMLGVGQLVGEVGLFDGGTHPMTAQTITAARVLVFPAPAILGLVQESPAFCRFLLGAMSVRLQALVQQLSHLKLMTASQRVGAHLLGLLGGRHGGVEAARSGEGIALHLGCGRRALAGMLGMSPESLSRAFRALADWGVRVGSRDVIFIGNLDQLRAHVRPPPRGDEPSRGGGRWGACVRAPSVQESGTAGAGRGYRGLALSDPELATVCRSPLFAAMPEAMVRSLVAEARLAVHETATLLFSQADPADRCFVVLSGGVRLFVATPEGRETQIDTIGPGSGFAEAAVFGPARMPVNAEALAGSRLLVLPARVLLARVDADPAFSFMMLASLARRQRERIERVLEMKVCSPLQRLASALAGLTAVEAGPVTLHLPLTKAALAGHIGITAESLSRAMVRLAPMGVTCHGAEIVIADVARLRGYGRGDDERDGGCRGACLGV